MRQSKKEITLQSIIKMLREADSVVSKKEEKGEDSLDDQIDRYLTNYESEAKNSKNEGLDLRSITRRFLVEADDEEDKKEKSEDKSTVKTLSIEDIDVSSFAKDVMRLVDNYDTLLEIRNTILRRASNYLSKNYEQNVVDAFKEELMENYDTEIGETEAEKQDKFQPPKAAAAGPMGGGGAG